MLEALPPSPRSVTRGGRTVQSARREAGARPPTCGLQGSNPLAETSYRQIGLSWRKGSNRVDEFKLLGKFLQDNA